MTFVYEETLNCLKSLKNKRIKINMQYYLNDKKLNKIEKQKAEKDEVQTSSFFYLAIQILRDDLTSSVSIKYCGIN